MKPTVVILLSDKRSGSTQFERELCRHRDVQHASYCAHSYNETHHWLKSAVILDMPSRHFADGHRYKGYGGKKGARALLVNQLRGNLPDFTLPEDDRRLVFEGWEALCREFAGPVFFEKSPQHLAHWSALSLMLEWAQETDFEVKFIKRMTEDTIDINTTEGKQDFVRNLVAYNVILEGIWFYSGFMVALSFRQRNLLRNFGSLVDWIVRDESLHLKFGINLILTVLEENPDLQTPEFASEIRQMILDAVEMEEAYNHDLLPGGILGLNANYINQYVKYLADRRLEELGFETEYNVSNPAKWMATANDTLQLVNFFESTNTSYEVNATSSK